MTNEYEMPSNNIIVTLIVISELVENRDAHSCGAELRLDLKKRFKSNFHHDTPILIELNAKNK